jgi:putative phage-type endonuclease
MKIQKFDNRDDWLDARIGRITGTRLGSLLSKRDKKPIQGFYELIAERIAIPHNGENVMDRGIRLEDEALERFAKETKKKVNSDLVIWHRDDDESIAVSPDGSIGKTEAIECKCLSSARHLEAFITKEIPSEYETQALQYFIVNENLKTLYFVFYDPRMPKDFFWLEIHRKDIKEKVEEFLALEREVLAEITRIENELTF